MKKYFIFFVFLSCNYFMKAQHVEWTSEAIDVLYFGYNNVLPLKFIDIDEEKVELSVTYGKISKSDNGSYIWYADGSSNLGSIVQLIIIYDGKELAKFERPFKRIPNPTAVLLPHQLATPKTMTGIRGVFPGAKIKISIRVIGYQINIIDRGETFILKNKGGSLTDSNMAMLKSVSRKAEVLITKIRFKCPGDTVGRLVNEIQLQ